MAFSTLASRVAEACAAHLGDEILYTDGAAAETTCDCILIRRAEPILRGGQIVIDEDHYQAQIPVSALAAEPAIGDTVTTAAGVTYRVDLTPELNDGMWVLTLRRTTG